MLEWSEQQRFPHLQQALKLLDGDEVGMRPLIIQKLELFPLLSGEGLVRCLFSLTPACNNQSATCHVEHSECYSCERDLCAIADGQTQGLVSSYERAYARIKQGDARIQQLARGEPPASPHSPARGSSPPSSAWTSVWWSRRMRQSQAPSDNEENAEEEGEAQQHEEPEQRLQLPQQPAMQQLGL